MSPAQSTYILEHYSVCPLVRIGTPTRSPVGRKRVYPSPRNQGGTHSPAGEGVVPIQTTGEKPGTLSTCGLRYTVQKTEKTQFHQSSRAFSLNESKNGQKKGLSK